MAANHVGVAKQQVNVVKTTLILNLISKQEDIFK